MLFSDLWRKERGVGWLGERLQGEGDAEGGADL